MWVAELVLVLRAAVPGSPTDPSADSRRPAGLHSATTRLPNWAQSVELAADGRECSAADTAELAVDDGSGPAAWVEGDRPAESSAVLPGVEASVGSAGWPHKQVSLGAAAVGEVGLGSRHTSRRYSSMTVPVRRAGSIPSAPDGSGAGPWQAPLATVARPVVLPGAGSALGRRMIQRCPRVVQVRRPAGPRPVPRLLAHPD